MSKIAFDPTQAQIDALANEPPVSPTRLSPDWLRRRFVEPVIWTPEFGAESEMNLSGRPPVPAAVLVPLSSVEESS